MSPVIAAMGWVIAGCALAGWVLNARRWRSRERGHLRTIYRSGLDFQAASALLRRKGRISADDEDMNPEIALRIRHAIDEGERISAGTMRRLREMADGLGLDHDAEVAARMPETTRERFIRKPMAQA